MAKLTILITAAVAIVGGARAQSGSETITAAPSQTSITDPSQCTGDSSAMSEYNKCYESHQSILVTDCLGTETSVATAAPTDDSKAAGCHCDWIRAMASECYPIICTGGVAVNSDAYCYTFSGASTASKTSSASGSHSTATGDKASSTGTGTGTGTGSGNAGVPKATAAVGLIAAAGAAVIGAVAVL